MTDYEVKVSLDGSLLKNKTEGFVSTTSCRTQNEPDQFGTVWVMENIDKVHFNNSGTDTVGICYNYGIILLISP